MATQDVERIYRLIVDANETIANIKKTSKAVQGIESTLLNFRKVLSTIFFAGVAIRYFTSMAMAVVNAKEKIDLLRASMTVLNRGDAAEGAAAVANAFEIVASTGASLDSVVDGIKRITIGLSEYGANQEQVAALTENFLKLGRVAGASQADIEGAMYQLSQGLSSGRLQGDELRSILERMPLAVQRIADSMGISIGELREMAAQGQITGDVIFNALTQPIEGLEDINDMFNELPVTVAQMGNVFKGEFTQGLAKLEGMLEIGNMLVFAMDQLREMFSGFTETNESIKFFEGVAWLFRQIVFLALGVVGTVKNIAIALGGLWEATSLALKGRFREAWGTIKDLDAALNETWDQLDRIQDWAKTGEFEATLKESNRVVERLEKNTEGLKNELREVVDTITGMTAITTLEDDLYQSLLEQAKEFTRIQGVLPRLVKELNDALDEGTISVQAHARAMSQLQGYMIEMQEETEELSAVSQEWLGLMENALDGFVDSLLTGRVSFAQFAASVISDVAKMVARLLILNDLMANIAAMMPTTTVPGGTYYAMPAGGGHYPNPGVPRDGGTTVNIQNYGNAEVQPMVSSQGGRQVIDVLVRDGVRSALSDGSLDSTLANNYGLHRGRR